MILLYTHEDVSWAIEQFLPDYNLAVPGSCVLHGTEESPTRLDFYLSNDPDFYDTPVVVVQF
jgi:hypothetical protein